MRDGARRRAHSHAGVRKSADPAPGGARGPRAKVRPATIRAIANHKTRRVDTTRRVESFAEEDAKEILHGGDGAREPGAVREARGDQSQFLPLPLPLPLLLPLHWPSSSSSGISKVLTMRARWFLSEPQSLIVFFLPAPFRKHEG